MKKTKLFLSILVLLAVGITGWSVINNEEQNENDNFSENLEALTLPPEENPGETPNCDNKNGFKIWSINGGFLQHKKHFYDCCYKLREGYSPEEACAE